LLNFRVLKELSTHLSPFLNSSFYIEVLCLTETFRIFILDLEFRKKNKIIFGYIRFSICQFYSTDINSFIDLIYGKMMYNYYFALDI